MDLYDAKDVGTNLLPVPLLEAFALPNPVEQTTLEPHADMKYSIPLWQPYNYET